MQSQIRGYGICPKCEHITLVKTSAKHPIWECLNDECGVFVDDDGDVYEPSQFKTEVKL